MIRSALFLLISLTCPLIGNPFEAPFADLKGKVVVITGGAGGIGEAVASSYTTLGSQVVIVDKEQNKGQDLADKLNAYFIEAELADTTACRKVVEETLSRFGKIDILINNAGTNDSVGISSSPKAFQKSVQKNLMHYFSLVHFAREALIMQKGAIINIASRVAVTGQGHTSGYAASKGGILALTREWAAELAKDGVRVNAVIPAAVTTGSAGYKLDKGTLPSLVPLEKRLTTTQEIANIVIFLTSSFSSHTTGQHIYVDGGYTHLDRAL